MLGEEIVKSFESQGKYEIHGIDICELDYRSSAFTQHIFDLTDLEALSAVLEEVNPNLIIHAAAIVNLKTCEQDFPLAKRLHADVSRQLAKFDAKIIYISTDSVFNGIKGEYAESDVPDPLNNYAVSKLLGELAVQANSSNSIIIRTNIFGFNYPLKASLAEWCIKSLEGGEVLYGYKDVYFNAIYTAQLAEIIFQLVKLNYVGLINIASSNKISKYEFLQTLANSLGFSKEQVKKASIFDDGEPVNRPLDTTLSVLKASKILRLPNIYEGITDLISDYKEFSHEK